MTSPKHRITFAPAWISSIVGGSVLVLIGATMFADELGYQLPHRWMALILLVPAIAAIADSIVLGLRLRRADIPVVSRGIVGVLFGAIGILLFLRISTGVLLPILIVALGAGAIVRAFFLEN
ncbi:MULTISPECIES: hypothetical protein [unclassified Sinorhizobium]|uniref:hypothetical protein n=1 Tax=unclassified Sinorhizobium TaxID=2613772 RepID=UPI003525AFA5